MRVGRGGGPLECSLGTLGMDLGYLNWKIRLRKEE